MKPEAFPCFLGLTVSGSSAVKGPRAMLLKNCTSTIAPAKGQKEGALPRSSRPAAATSEPLTT